MISDIAAEVCAVAKFYGTTPPDVWGWTNPDYLDAVEFMAMSNEAQRQANRRHDVNSD